MELQSAVYHVPALLEECIDGLNIQPGGTYVDVTFGGGGHSRAILGHLGECGRLFSLDQDEDARQNSLDDPRFTFVHSNFRFLKNFMRYYGVERVDGILADLGVSFHHFDDSDRGFSFRFEGPLDMRMNRRSGQTAAQLIATCSEEKLADLFFLYGELKSARRIAAAVVAARSSAPIETTERLLEVVRPYINRKQEKKGIGSVVSGFADRGKPRNGKSAPVVGTVGRVTSAGRPIGGSYVPFVGRSHGQEFHEDG